MAHSNDPAAPSDLGLQQQGRPDPVNTTDTGYDPQVAPNASYPGQQPSPDYTQQQQSSFGANPDPLAGYHYPSNQPLPSGPEGSTQGETPAPFAPNDFGTEFREQSQDPFTTPYPATNTSPETTPGHPETTPGHLDYQQPTANAPVSGYQDPNFQAAPPPVAPGSYPSAETTQGYPDIPQQGLPHQHGPDTGNFSGAQNPPIYNDQHVYPTDPSYAGAPPANDPNAGWAQPGEDAFAPPPPHGEAPGLDAPHPDPQQGYASAYGEQAGHSPEEFRPMEAAGQQQHLEPTYDEQEEYENEGPRGFSRMYLIGGVLVAAIAIGGGLAYAYKVLLGPDPKIAEAPVVRGKTSPTKTRPDQPGGRKFGHTDSKIMERLGANGKSAAKDGTRRVPTVVVGRDGAIVPSQTTATANSEPMVSVPGLTIVDALGNPQPTTASQANPTGTDTSKPLVVKPPSQTATKPVVITNAKPTTKPAPTTTTTTRPAPTTTATTTRSTQTSPTTSTGGGAGYVAVLASVPVSSRSRMDALAQYADLQQKYGSLLKNKTPDVKEANLGARGRYHRLLVGPPSSRAQASNLCNQLKGAGYKGCWVTAY